MTNGQDSSVMREINRLLDRVETQYPDHPMFDDIVKKISNLNTSNFGTEFKQVTEMFSKMDKVETTKDGFFCIECGQEMLRPTSNNKCATCSQLQTFIVVKGDLEKPDEFAKEIAKKLDEGYFCKDAIKQKDDQLFQFMQLKTEARK